MKRSLSDHENAEMVAKILAAKQKSWGDMTLYFGCRRSDLDHIYKDELNRAKVAGALTDVHVAFSRDLKQPKVNVYRQLFITFAPGHRILSVFSSEDGGWCLVLY